MGRKFCRKCRRFIPEPSHRSISTYAAYCRNICSLCGGELKKVSDRESLPVPTSDTDGDGRTKQMQEDAEREAFFRSRKTRLMEAAARPLHRRLAELSIEHADQDCIDLSDLDIMTGREFEEFIACLFDDFGANVIVTKTSGDQGGDIVVERDSERLVIQTKRSRFPISNSAVQEVVAAMPVYGCTRSVVVTNSTFTKSAQILASANNVWLLDRSQLEVVLRSNTTPTIDGA